MLLPDDRLYLLNETFGLVVEEGLVGVLFTGLEGTCIVVAPFDEWLNNHQNNYF